MDEEGEKKEREGHNAIGISWHMPWPRVAVFWYLINYQIRVSHLCFMSGKQKKYNKWSEKPYKEISLQYFQLMPMCDTKITRGHMLNEADTIE
jgi:hypothetical protein